MVPPDPAASRGHAVPKTLTQIGREQFEEVMEVTYNGKVKKLWNRMSKRECEESLQAMGSVVQNTLDRLSVECRNQDLYMAFEAMDVREWHELLDRPQPENVPLSEAGQMRILDMKRKAKRLLDACGIDMSGPEFLMAVRAVQAVSRADNSLREERDNRILWARALTAPASSQEHEDALSRLRPLIVFYIAYMDGTGDVERLLGRHASFLHVHHASSEIAEACLEVSSCADSEGLGETWLFQKDGSVLQLTDVSRRCAQLWVSMHGRRFGCYKIRKDKNCQREPRKGTQASVKVGQATAMQQLMSLRASGAKRQTLDGVDRERLARSARTRAPLDMSKEMVDFQKTTARKREEKSKVSVWAGIWQKAVTSRPNNALAASQGQSTEAAVASLGTQAPLPRKRSRESPSAPTPLGGKLKMAVATRLKEAEHAAKKSRLDAQKGGKLADVTQREPGGDLAGMSATSSSMLVPRSQEGLHSRAPAAARHAPDNQPVKRRSQHSGTMSSVGTKPLRFGQLLRKVTEQSARNAMKHRSKLSAASQGAAAQLSWARQGDSYRMMRKAAVVRVHTVDDLDVRAGIDDKRSASMLMAWLAIVVFGKVAQDGGRTVQYASVKDRSVHLSLTEEFTRKHRRLTGVLQQVADTSMWKVDTTSGGRRIDSLQSLASVLRSVRRLCPRPAASLGAV